MKKSKGEGYQDNLQMVLDAQSTCCVRSRSKASSKSIGNLDDSESTRNEKTDKRQTIDGSVEVVPELVRRRRRGVVDDRRNLRPATEIISSKPTI